MALRFHIFIYSFCLVLLCLLGCSSSNVEDEGSEVPTEASLDENTEGLNELTDELGLDDSGGLPDGTLGDDSLAELPDSPPGDDSTVSLDEDSGLPSLPLAEADSQESSSDFPAFDTGTSDFSSGLPQKIPVKKIKTFPFHRAGILANAVYIARSGEDLNSISQKIFGADRTAELLQVNPNLHRGVDVGDKVYYNSPNRPSDGDNLLFYYEDMGATPQQYNVVRNDNIRDLAETLLGERESWKEIWATNLEVESKWNLREGLVLRYWAATSTPPPPLMETAETIPQDSEVIGDDGSIPEVPDIAANTGDSLPGSDGVPPPPPPIADQDEFPPPPPGGDMDNDFPPPPPPPGGGMDDLPPPPPPIGGIGDQSSPGGGLLEDDNSLMLLAVGVVIVMFVMIVAIRRKSRKRKMRVDIGDTQI